MAAGWPWLEAVAVAVAVAVASGPKTQKNLVWAAAAKPSSSGSSSSSSGRRERIDANGRPSSVAPRAPGETSKFVLVRELVPDISSG